MKKKQTMTMQWRGIQAFVSPELPIHSVRRPCDGGRIPGTGTPEWLLFGLPLFVAVH